MSIRVDYEDVKKTVKQAFLNLGLTEEQAETCAVIHTQSSADGVESHGLNRIPRFAEYVQKGWINLEGQPQLTGAKGAVENYDGQLGIGITNALFCADRAVELAKEHGIGCVALRNTTHWMRGGTYAWKMAEAGFMGLSWINTESCMPLWGSDKPSVGNNPFCIAIPREDGPVVLDMAMSQYAYGKLGVYRLGGSSFHIPAVLIKREISPAIPAPLRTAGGSFLPDTGREAVWLLPSIWLPPLWQMETAVQIWMNRIREAVQAVARSLLPMIHICLVPERRSRQCLIGGLRLQMRRIRNGRADL